MDKNLTESEEKILLLGTIDILIYRKNLDFECVWGGGGLVCV